MKNLCEEIETNLGNTDACIYTHTHAEWGILASCSCNMTFGFLNLYAEVFSREVEKLSGNSHIDYLGDGSCLQACFVMVMKRRDSLTKLKAK